MALPAILKLSCLPAQRGPGGTVQTILTIGKLDDVAPPRSVEIRTAADAQKAFEEYAASVTVPAHVAGRLARGHRAPRGFNALRLHRHVNI